MPIYFVLKFNRGLWFFLAGTCNAVTFKFAVRLALEASVICGELSTRTSAVLNRLLSDVLLDRNDCSFA